MKFAKTIAALAAVCSIALSSTVKIDNMKISDYIKMVSKISKKNILLTSPISGTVNFISSAPVDDSELFNILLSVLEAKGYTIVDHGGYLKIVRISKASKEGLKFSSNTPGVMRTKIIRVNNANVDVVASKVRQFLSPGGKIITLRDANSMVVADFPRNIDTIQKIAAFVDKDPYSKMKIYFLKLKNAKASRVEPKISKMARSLVNERIPTNRIEVVSDDATNSIIVVATPQNAKKLLPYIKRLDAKNNGSEQNVAVIPLENAEASDMVKTISDLLSKKKYPREEDRPTISVDQEMNSLIVSAKGEDVEIIKKMVKLLDKPRPQVYIRAKIIEISEKKVKRIGARFGLEGGKVTPVSLLTAAVEMGGSPIAGNLVSGFLDVPKNLTEGVALGAFIDFLSNEGAAEILSEPSILCVNNKESSIYVGKTESVLVSSVQGSSTTDLARNTYKRQDIGLTLKIKPRISSGNKVTIKADIIQEDTVGGQPGLPTTTKRLVNTTAIVNNGESVILGGLIKAKYDDKETGIPILKDIPIAGAIFRSRERIRDKVNLVIILTPFIVQGEEDMRELKKELYRLDEMERKYYEILVKKLKEKDVKNGKTRDTNDIGL